MAQEVGAGRTGWALFEVGGMVWWQEGESLGWRAEGVGEGGRSGGEGGDGDPGDVCEVAVTGRGRNGRYSWSWGRPAEWAISREVRKVPGLF